MEEIDLKGLREQAGLSQTRFAGRLETSTSVIANWETGVYSPAMASLVKIARVLDLPVAEVIAGAEVSKAKAAREAS